MRYYYMNMETGEIYRNLFHALRTILKDMLRYPECRTRKMFSLQKGEF